MRALCVVAGWVDWMIITNHGVRDRTPFFAFSNFVPPLPPPISRSLKRLLKFEQCAEPCSITLKQLSRRSWKLDTVRMRPHISMYVHHMIRHVRVLYHVSYVATYSKRHRFFIDHHCTTRYSRRSNKIFSYYVLRIAYGTYVRTVLPVSFIIPYCMLNMCDVWAAEV